MDIVSEVFERVFVLIRSGGGPTTNFRAYLFEIVRRSTTSRHRARLPLPVENIHDHVTRLSAPTQARFDDVIVTMIVLGDAFRTLPMRWQTILRDALLFDLDPADMAPHLGLSTNAAAALRLRALRGLQAQYRVLTHEANE